MQMYNARLYAGSVPVFYLPYFAYPTDTTRRTGLLRPTFGFSSDGSDDDLNVSIRVVKETGYAYIQ
jgi:lipopolysaccharide assembly outer membrane protein LptD (OstA)